MLVLVFFETALELVPKRIASHPSVIRNAKKRRKKPEETLLDRSLHHFAMRGLPGSEKRGRPDIIQYCLLEALGSPLNKRGNLKIYINTINEKTIELDQKVRLPRKNSRFNSLMEQLLAHGQVPPNTENPLMKVSTESLADLKRREKPSCTIALTSHGKDQSLKNLCNRLKDETHPFVMIGAYPHGTMRVETRTIIDDSFSIYSEVLDAWTVTSRLLYECESQLGIL